MHINSPVTRYSYSAGHIPGTNIIQPYAREDLRNFEIQTIFLLQMFFNAVFDENFIKL